MTTAQAASMSTPRSPIASLSDKAAQPDAGRPGDGAWQRAFATASQDSSPSTADATQAGYLLALGNLGATPVETQAPATTALPAAPAPDAAPAIAPSAHAHGASRFATRAPSAARPATFASVDASHETGPAHAASPARAAIVSAREATVQHGERSSSSRRSMASEADRPVSAAFDTMPTQAVHALSAYSEALATASAPHEREAGFTIVPRSTPVPVRVHVQWRDRVADVWIGLHRQAFDQLPDIRAGVQDWIIARGGVLGHVVCNGETLSRVTPSNDLQGAL